MREAEGCLMDYKVIKAETIQPETVSAIMGTQDGKRKPVRWTRKLTVVHTLACHQASMFWLKSELLKESPHDNTPDTVVVSHHYPTKNSTAPRYFQELTNAGFGSQLPTAIPIWPTKHDAKS